SMLVMTGVTLLTMKTSAPRLKIFSATYPLMPLTNVTTAMTAATPMTTPSKVRADLNLFAHSDCRAMRMASAMFIRYQVAVPSYLFLPLGGSVQSLTGG